MIFPTNMSEWNPHGLMLCRTLLTQMVPVTFAQVCLWLYLETISGKVFFFFPPQLFSSVVRWVFESWLYEDLPQHSDTLSYTLMLACKNVRNDYVNMLMFNRYDIYHIRHLGLIKLNSVHDNFKITPHFHTNKTQKQIISQIISISLQYTDQLSSSWKCPIDVIFFF